MLQKGKQTNYGTFSAIIVLPARISLKLEVLVQAKEVLSLK